MAVAVPVPGGDFEAEELLGKAVAFAVGIMMQGAEFFFDAKPGGVAEEVGKLDGLAVRFGSLQLFGAQAGGRDSKQFRPDLDEAAKQHLLLFEFGAMAEHGMKQGAGQPAAGSRSVA